MYVVLFFTIVNGDSKVLCFYCFQESIVHQLKRRYEQNMIYTYIGDILLALNPFQNLGMYSEQVRAQGCIAGCLRPYTSFLTGVND